MPDVGETPESDPPNGDDAARDRPVVQLAPPISDTAWSPDFVMQSIEILPVFLAGGDPLWAKPIHADSYRVGWPASKAPGEVVLDTLGRLGFDPFLAHSTSWRHEEGRVVLTYVAVVREPEFGPDAAIVPVPVGHSELARGDEFAPPLEIGDPGCGARLSSSLLAGEG